MESKLLDVNEFMVEPAEDEIEDEESESYSVIEVPKNIDFVFSASLDEIKYDKLVLKSAKGRVIVKDGEVILDNLFTKTLGGAIGFNGLYSTKDMKKPSFDMSLDVKAIEIASAFQSFSTIQALAPVAANATGKTSTLFSLKGILQEDMMPDLATLTGQGKVTLSDASLKNSKLASGLTSYLKGGENQSLSLKDLSMYVKINDGKLQVEPFDLKLNNSKANISGTTSLEGTLDYKIKMDVPVGQLGTKVNSLLGSVTGAEGASETLSLNIGLGGTYSDPKFNLLGSDGKSAVASAAKEKAADVIKEKTGVDVPVTKEELNKEAVAKAKAEADKLLTEAQKQADQVKLEAKRSADKLREEAQTQSDKLMKEAGNNILKKKAAELAGKKLVEEAEVQATRLEQEGNKKADLIMTKAQKSADTLIKNAENK